MKERREIDKEIVFFMGKVTEYMREDKIWKDNYIKSRIENRVTKVETKINSIGKSLYLIGLFIVGLCSRVIYKLFHS